MSLKSHRNHCSNEKLEELYTDDCEPFSKCTLTEFKSIVGNSCIKLKKVAQKREKHDWKNRVHTNRFVIWAYSECNLKKIEKRKKTKKKTKKKMKKRRKMATLKALKHCVILDRRRKERKKWNSVANRFKVRDAGEKQKWVLRVGIRMQKAVRACCECVARAESTDVRSKNRSSWHFRSRCCCDGANENDGVGCCCYW